MGKITKQDTVALGVIKLTSEELKKSMVQIKTGEWKPVTHREGHSHFFGEKIPFNKLIASKISALLGYRTSMKSGFRQCGDMYLVAYADCNHVQSIAVRILKDLFNPLEDRTFDMSTKCVQCGEDLVKVFSDEFESSPRPAKSLPILTAEPASFTLKNEPFYPYGDSSSEADYLEEIEMPTKKRKRVDQPSSSAASVKTSKLGPPTVFDEFDKLLVNCAKKEIRKSVGKVQQLCSNKDRSASYIALLNESPYIAMNVCKVLADLGLKLKNDIESARRTLESEIEQSLSRNMKGSESDNESEDDSI